ncbi:MAG: CHASE3 domain-containing protein, partial [Acidobacteriota bacterium]|nr:CHASE3 domain-containing protein [Acidobacteriota bacterium]
IITGNPSFLEPYDKARQQALPASLADLGRLLIRNKAQQVRLARLHSLIDEKLNQIQTTINARRDQSFNSARELIASRDNDGVMNQIRAIASEMDAEEEKLLEQRAGHVQASEARILWLAAVTAAFSVAARIWIGIRASRRSRAG